MTELLLPPGKLLGLPVERGRAFVRQYVANIALNHVSKRMVLRFDDPEMSPFNDGCFGDLPLFANLGKLGEGRRERWAPLRRTLIR